MRKLHITTWRKNDMYPQYDPLFDAAIRQREHENLQLELKLKETNRNLIKNQIAEIPQMSDRQLLEAIYKQLLLNDR